MSEGLTTSDGLNAAGIRADARRERLALAGLTAPSFLILGTLLFITVGWLFWLSAFGDNVFTLENYTRMVVEPAYASVFLTTFELSLLVTMLAVLLGYPLSYMIALLPPRAASICLTLVLIPFWTALLVRTYAWLVLLQRHGVVNSLLMGWGVIDAPLPLVDNFTGTVIGMLHIMIPFLVRPLYANMRAIDRDYVRAAASLGASPAAAFWRVYLPLSMPGLTAGTVMVFVICLGFYITPQFLGGGRITTISMKIQQNVATYFDWGAASSLGVVLFAITMAVLWAVSRLASLRRLTEVDGS
jgi:putative spermidine/putrescine transport system permease protein/spermidine/putrescine transport system permease protein